MQRHFIARLNSLLTSTAVPGQRCEGPLFLSCGQDTLRVHQCIGSHRSFHSTASNYYKRRLPGRNNRGDDRNRNRMQEKYSKHFKRPEGSRDNRGAGGRGGGRLPRESRGFISILVEQETASAEEKFDPRVLGACWTAPSHPTSSHPTVSEVLTTGKLPDMDNAVRKWKLQS